MNHDYILVYFLLNFILHFSHFLVIFKYYYLYNFFPFFTPQDNHFELPKYNYNLLNHSTIFGHLLCLHFFFTILNNIVMNILCIKNSESKILKSKNKNIFNIFLCRQGFYYP